MKVELLRSSSEASKPPRCLHDTACNHFCAILKTFRTPFLSHMEIILSKYNQSIINPYALSRGDCKRGRVAPASRLATSHLQSLCGYVSTQKRSTSPGSYPRTTQALVFSKQVNTTKRTSPSHATPYALMHPIHFRTQKYTEVVRESKELTRPYTMMGPTRVQ